MARQSIKSIETQIKKLQARAQAMREKDRRPVIASIVKQMKAHDISTEDIAEALARSATRRSRAPGAAQAPGAAPRTVPPKYRNPEDGTTWTGRGRTPRWILDAEAQGKDRSSFAI